MNTTISFEEYVQLKTERDELKKALESVMKIAWLIERGQGQQQDPPIWWAGNGVIGEWTEQVNLAVRFARKADGEVVGRMMLQLGMPETMWTVVEHAWS